MPTWLTVLMAVLSTLATLGALLAGVAYFLGTLRKSNAELWRQNAEAYEKANQQKDKELGEIKARLTELEKELHSVKADNREIVRLNVDLQLGMERKDCEITDLKALMATLRTENSDLNRRIMMQADPRH